MSKWLLLTFLLLIVFPASVIATIGVGVGTGKIQVEDKLKPGIIYKLPSLVVINTGDEPSDYEVSVSYHTKQPQLRPPQSWFIFSPQKFHLDPGKVQAVNINLNLPIITSPGEYFAYLESQPVRKISRGGGAFIGVAAAAKLYFTIVPANIFYGIYYKIISFWNVYAPWPQRVAIIIGVLLILVMVKKFFNIQINLKKPHDK